MSPLAGEARPTLGRWRTRTVARRAFACVLTASALASCAPDAILAKPRKTDPGTLVVNIYTEPESIDPAHAHAHPDHVVARQLFDGLYEADPATLAPIPSLAIHHDVSDDGRRHVLTLDPRAVWSDGRALTADDVVGSIERVLRPSTASRAAAVLSVIENARAYVEGRVRRVVGAGVRPRRPPFVVFGDERAPALSLGTFPEGAVVDLVDSNLRRAREDAPLDLREEPRDDAPVVTTMARGATALVLAQKDARGVTWVQVRPDEGGRAAWARASTLVAAYRAVDLRAVEGERARGHRRAVLTAPKADADVAFLVDDEEDLEVLSDDGEFARIHHPSSARTGYVPSDALDDVAGDRVWYVARVQGAVGVTHVREGWVRARDLTTDGAALGVRAIDPHTVELRLVEPVAHLASLLTLAAFRPVPLHVVERHGRAWTRPEHIVTSGAFHLTGIAPRARYVLHRSETSLHRDSVALTRVIFLFVVDEHTSIALYRAGEIDVMLAGKLPLELVPNLRGRDDYVFGPAFATYFVKVQTARPPLDDARVRRALDLAIDKELLTTHLLRAGQRPATTLVPPGLPGYPIVDGEGSDPARARALLTEAGYEGGKGFPRLTYLFNTSEHHRAIAELLQQAWREVLGIDVELENQEWKTYLQRMRAGDYDLARSGWIGEFLDPASFLEQFTSSSPNNETGFASAEYDERVLDAARIVDDEERMRSLATAERALLAERPFLPLFFYVNNTMRVPEVQGYEMNLLDHHALRFVRIDPSLRERAP